MGKFPKNKSIIELLGKEYLENLIKSSSCVSDVLRGYNLCTGGSASRTALNRLAEQWEVDLKFSKKNISKKHSEVARKRPVEEVLCQNSKVSQTCLRRTVRREETLDLTKCSICGINNVWNNKPMQLILDHINGVNNDNRVENLRMICPNCNSQLETTGSRNIKNRCQ